MKHFTIDRDGRVRDVEKPAGFQEWPLLCKLLAQAADDTEGEDSETLVSALDVAQDYRHRLLP